MTDTLQLHADLSVYPKFWGYQVFIYSGYCSCHCRLPSEESMSGIPFITETRPFKHVDRENANK